MATPSLTVATSPIFRQPSTQFVSGIPITTVVRSHIFGSPPHLFLNNYELLSVLGEGSFGEAVLAHRKASGELDFAEFVALKCFSKSRLSKKRDIRKVGGRMAVTTALDKVGVELRVLAALSAAGGNPYVARLREVLNDPTSDDLYFVLDYCDGGDLMTYDAEDDCFRSRFTEGPLTLAQCRQVMHDLALALSFCHSLGVAHRDVKPDNLLLTSAGRCVLSDFGVARLFAPPEAKPEMDAPGTEPPPSPPTLPPAPPSAAAGAASVPSPAHEAPPPSPPPPPPPPPSPLPLDWVQDTAGSYMFLCPEAAAGEGYSAFSADLWAAGVTLYILLFGVAPFGRGCRDPEALFEAIHSQPLGLLPWDRALKVGGDLHTAPEPPPDAFSGARASFCGNEARAPPPPPPPPRASFSPETYGGDGSAKAEVTDLLRRLLSKDPDRRLRSAEELMAHPFLRVAYDAGEAQSCAAPPPLVLKREAIPPIDASRLPLYVTPEMAMQGVAEVPSGSGSGSSPPRGGAGAGAGAGAGLMIVREGWLLKQGQARKTWKRRFFRLTAEGLLRYFKEKPSNGRAPEAGGGLGGGLSALASWVRTVAGAGSGEGVVQLSAAAHMVRSPKPGMPWRIVVGARERLLKLQAESEADAEGWDRALRVFTSTATSAAAGFLHAAEID